MTDSKRIVLPDAVSPPPEPASWEVVYFADDDEYRVWNPDSKQWMAFPSELAALPNELQRLRARVAELEAERDEWQEKAERLQRQYLRLLEQALKARDVLNTAVQPQWPGGAKRECA